MNLLSLVLTWNSFTLGSNVSGLDFGRVNTHTLWLQKATTLFLCNLNIDLKWVKSIWNKMFLKIFCNVFILLLKINVKMNELLQLCINQFLCIYHLPVCSKVPNNTFPHFIWNYIFRSNHCMPINLFNILPFDSPRIF